MPLADQIKARTRRRKDAEAKKPEAAAAAPVNPRPAGQVGDPADVAEYCAANGCATLAGPLIRSRAPWSQVEEAVGRVDMIRAMVKDAASITSTITLAAAERYIAAGISVEDARAQLWNAVCDAQSPEIRSSIGADDGMSGSTSSADRAARDRVIDRLNDQTDALSGGRAVSGYGAASRRQQEA